jgi:hypothetical protein
METSTFHQLMWFVAHVPIGPNERNIDILLTLVFGIDHGNIDIPSTHVVRRTCADRTE